jgi:cyanate permease
MKLIVLWSLFIGYCIGGVVSLALDQRTGTWSNALICFAVFVPGALLTLYTERVRHPRKKALPRRQSQLKVSRKVANSR